MFQKPFIIDNGQFYYPKKPLHKQPLFWTTIAGVLLSIFLGIMLLLMSLAWGVHGFIEYTDGTPGVDDHQYKKAGDPSMYTEYRFGDMKEVEDGLEVTVTSVKKDTTIELVGNGEVAVVAEVTIANTSQENYYLNEFDFVLYDREDNFYNLDFRTYDINIPEKIAPGETVQLKLIYGGDAAEGYGLSFNEFIWRETLGGTV